MIANQCTMASAAKAVDYLRYGKAGQRVPEAERVAWMTTRNLPTDEPDLARRIMENTAKLSHRVEKPYYSMSISFSPGDNPDRQLMERAADEVLKDLGLENHQAIIVAHKDRDHPHFHILVNRVDLETGKVWKNSHDYATTDKTLRRFERLHDLKQVPTWRTDPQEQQRMPSVPRASQVDFVEELHQRGIPADLKASRSWPEIVDRLAAHGLVLQRSGRGLQLTDGERVAKISALHRKSSKVNLEKRFGETWKNWAERSPETAYEPEKQISRKEPDPQIAARVQNLEPLSEQTVRQDTLAGEIEDLEETCRETIEQWHEFKGDVKTLEQKVRSVMSKVQWEHRSEIWGQIDKGNKDPKIKTSQLVGNWSVWGGSDSSRKRAKKAVKGLPDLLTELEEKREVVKATRKAMNLGFRKKDALEKQLDPLSEVEVYRASQGVPIKHMENLPKNLKDSIVETRKEAVGVWTAIDGFAGHHRSISTLNLLKREWVVGKALMEAGSFVATVVGRLLPEHFRRVTRVVQAVLDRFDLERSKQRQTQKARNHGIER